MSGPVPSQEFLALQRAVAGRYSLEREIGRGGMGIVFLARDVALDRPVAVKLLPPLLASHDMKERFLREARTAARLSHPNIVPIHLVEERDDLVYFVMAFVDGESLGQQIRRRGRLPPSQVARVVQQVAWALAYAHKEGIVHRDIKPDNILIERDSGRAMVTDFGIARVARGDAVSGQGELVGTLHYMSPEQATGDSVDGRSDIYALGVTAFHALTGRLPYDGPTLPAVLHQQAGAPAPRVATLARHAPPQLAEAVDRCLERDRLRRFSTAADLATAVAPGVVARKEVPPEVRTLLRNLREAGIVGGAAGVVGYWFAIFGGMLDMTWQGGAHVPIVAIAVLAGWLLAFPAMMIGHARRILEKGMDADHVLDALADEARALEEEMELTGRSRARRIRRNREQWIRFGFPLAIFGGGLAIPALFEDPFLAFNFIIFFAAGLVGIGAGPSVDEDSPLRALPLYDRLLAGRFGRLLFRLAGIGLRRPDVSLAQTSQHTEAALASAADRIFDQMPSHVRQRFSTVPDVIEHLKQHAAALRQREEELNRSIATADHGSARGEGPGNLEATRSMVSERLEQTVAALEHIRLNLLRLHAGVGSPDELTADLDKARAIGEAVDAELAGQRDVAHLLASPGGRSTLPSAQT